MTVSLETLLQFQPQCASASMCHPTDLLPLFTHTHKHTHTCTHARTHIHNKHTRSLTYIFTRTISLSVCTLQGEARVWVTRASWRACRGRLDAVARPSRSLARFPSHACYLPSFPPYPSAAARLRVPPARPPPRGLIASTSRMPARFELPLLRRLSRFSPLSSSLSFPCGLPILSSTATQRVASVFFASFFVSPLPLCGYSVAHDVPPPPSPSFRARWETRRLKAWRACESQRSLSRATPRVDA